MDLGFTHHYYEISGSDLQMEDFDIADIQLVSPPDGATVSLPTTFQWITRPATPTDDYEFDLYDPDDSDPSWYTYPSLGIMAIITL